MLRDEDQRALNAIVKNFRESGRPLSYRKIGDAIGIRSTGSLYNIVRRLELAGKIERTPYYHCSIRPVA